MLYSLVGFASADTVRPELSDVVGTIDKDAHNVQTATAAMHCTEGICGMLVNVKTPRKS